MRMRAAVSTGCGALRARRPCMCTSCSFVILMQHRSPLCLSGPRANRHAGGWGAEGSEAPEDLASVHTLAWHEALCLRHPSGGPGGAPAAAAPWPSARRHPPARTPASRPGAPRSAPRPRGLHGAAPLLQTAPKPVPKVPHSSLTPASRALGVQPASCLPCNIRSPPALANCAPRRDSR